MNYIRPLPAYLVQRFQGWRATTYQDNRAWYRRFASWDEVDPSLPPLPETAEPEQAKPA